jgi:hypothetical protein
VLRDALPFFDKGPEFIQLAFFQVVLLDELITDPLAMMRRLLKNACDRVLIQIKDSGASPNAIAFGECFKHAIDGLLVSVKASEDAPVPAAEALVTFQTAIEWRAMWPVTRY